MTYLHDPAYIAAEADYVCAPEDRVAPGGAYLDEIAQRQEQRARDLAAQAAHRGLLAHIAALGMARDPAVPADTMEVMSRDA